MAGSLDDILTMLQVRVHGVRSLCGQKHGRGSDSCLRMSDGKGIRRGDRHCLRGSHPHHDHSTNTDHGCCREGGDEWDAEDRLDPADNIRHHHSGSLFCSQNF